MTKVLICDDAVAFGGLFMIWMQNLGIGDVAHARTGEEAVVLAAQLQPAVIVVDHLLPDANSRMLVPQLRAASPASKVLLISGMPDDQLAGAAAEAQADEYQSKASSARSMQDAVARLLA